MSLDFLWILVLVRVLVSTTQQNTPEIKTIEFTTLTRGAHKEIVITKDHVSIASTGKSEPDEPVKFKIEKSDWKALVKAVEDAPLDSISLFKSPTNKRAYDGAWHSAIVVELENKTVRHSFDNEEPNEKLAPLMELILELTNQSSQKK